MGINEERAAQGLRPYRVPIRYPVNGESGLMVEVVGHAVDRKVATTVATFLKPAPIIEPDWWATTINEEDDPAYD
jgi:hypothetical protein